MSVELKSGDSRCQRDSHTVPFLKVTLIMFESEKTSEPAEAIERGPRANATVLACGLSGIV